MAVLTAPSAVLAEVVYDNTKVFGTDIYYAPSRHGDEIELAGTAREVTQFIFGYASDVAVGASAHASVRFYANDGPKYSFANGTKVTPMPGSLLWQSDPIQLASGNQTVILTVPNIVVPDFFTWTMEFSGAIGRGTGLSITGPPTVGADLEGDRVGSYDDFWVQNDISKPDSWVLRRFGFVSSDFYAQVTAVGGTVVVPPLVAAFPVLQEGKALLNWTGGTAPFRVQFRPAIEAAWRDLAVTTNRSHTAAATGAAGFYQVVETPAVTDLFVSSIPTLKDGVLTLTWTGGYFPFRVQSKATVDGEWADLGTTNDRTFTTPAADPDRFYRILDAAD